MSGYEENWCVGDLEKDTGYNFHELVGKIISEHVTIALKEYLEKGHIYVMDNLDKGGVLNACCELTLKHGDSFKSSSVVGKDFTLSESMRMLDSDDTPDIFLDAWDKELNQCLAMVKKLREDKAKYS